MECSGVKINYPLKINSSFTIQKLQWKDFKGKPSESMPWSAHIYWTIQYMFKKKKNKKNPDVTAKVIILPQSWVRKENMSDALLAHQNGHYLIGCLCALQFLKKLNTSRTPMSYNYKQYAQIIFNMTLQQFTKLQKTYDQQTEHRLNIEKQQQWNKYLSKKIEEHIMEESQRKCAKRMEKKFILKTKYSNGSKNV